MVKHTWNIRVRTVIDNRFFVFVCRMPKKTQTSTTSLQKFKNSFVFVNKALEMLPMTGFVVNLVLFVLFFPPFSEHSRIYGEP